MTSQFPQARPRRLRRSPELRSLFQETEFTLNDLVLPIFVEEEIDDFVPITSMPGVLRIPEKKLAHEVERYARAGIKSVMTFGVSHHLDASGSDTWKERGLVSRMSSIIKDAVPEMIVMSDTCFCEYTDHGHCGVMHGAHVDNDATLVNLGKQAVAAARAFLFVEQRFAHSFAAVHRVHLVALAVALERAAHRLRGTGRRGPRRIWWSRP